MPKVAKKLEDHEIDAILAPKEEIATFYQLDAPYTQMVRGSMISYPEGHILSVKTDGFLVKTLKETGAKLVPIPKSCETIIQKFLACSKKAESNIRVEYATRATIAGGRPAASK